MNEFKKYIFGITFLFLSAQSWAQITFQKTFSTYGGCALSVQQTSDEGYIVGGWISGDLGQFNMCLIKTDKYGDTLWVKKFKSASEAIGYSVQQTNDGGYIIGGKTVNSPTNGFYLVKTDNNGDTVWSKIYIGDFWQEGCSIHQTFDGGYVIAGSNRTTFSNDFKVYIIKTNELGDTVWAKSYGDTTQWPDYGYSIMQTTDHGYIIAGMYDDSLASNADVYLIKTDSSGNLLWSKTYGGTSNDWGYYVQETHDGGYIIAGTSISFGIAWSGYLIRTDVSGNVSWTKIYTETNTGDNDIFFNCVRETADGGFIVAGYDHYSSNYRDMFMLNTDLNGNLRWAKSYGGSDYDEGEYVQQTSDGGFIFAGCESSFGHGIYLVKTDDFGNSGCNQSDKGINISSPPTQERNPVTLVFPFTNTTLSSPNTIVSGGCSVTTHCFSKGISDNSFNVFPNPSNNHFTIYSPNNLINKIVIFNTLGEIVYLNETVNQETKEIYCTLSAGIYFVRVATSEKELTEKLMIVKH